MILSLHGDHGADVHFWTIAQGMPEGGSFITLLWIECLSGGGRACRRSRIASEMKWVWEGGGDHVFMMSPLFLGVFFGVVIVSKHRLHRDALTHPLVSSARAGLGTFSAVLPKTG